MYGYGKTNLPLKKKNGKYGYGKPKIAFKEKNGKMNIPSFFSLEAYFIYIFYLYI
jgi:hypothetical protein